MIRAEFRADEHQVVYGRAICRALHEVDLPSEQWAAWVEHHKTCTAPWWDRMPARIITATIAWGVLAAFAAASGAPAAAVGVLLIVCWLCLLGDLSWPARGRVVRRREKP